MIAALQSEQRYTADGLADLLGVKRRTVFRDLAVIREAGVHCYYDTKTRCYSMNQKLFMPPLNLSPREMLSLLLLTRAEEHVLYPFRESTRWATIKIANSLPRSTMEICYAALRNISIKTNPRLNTEPFNKIFEYLLEAIVSERIVNIRYHLSGSDENLTTDLSPYWLRHDGQQWCVIGESSYHKRVYTFKLSYISGLAAVNKRFIKDRGFDINDYLGCAWSVMPAHMIYHVKLKFLPEAAHIVTNNQWHRTQKVTLAEDGSAIAEYRVDGLSEIIWWVFSHGNRVRVLAPDVLRERIVEMAKDVQKNNE